MSVVLSDIEITHAHTLAEGDQVIEKLLVFYKAYGEDGIGVFMSETNNALLHIGKQLRGLQEFHLQDLKSKDKDSDMGAIERLMKIAESGADLALKLKKLKEVRSTVAKEKVKEQPVDAPEPEEKEEEEEEDKRSFIDKRSDRLRENNR